MVMPTNIDQVDWNELGKEISRMRSLTEEQRENYFYNTWKGLPKEAEVMGNALFALVKDFYQARDFNRYVGLKYTDLENENGQIIRTAIMSFLGRRFSTF